MRVSVEEAQQRLLACAARPLANERVPAALSLGRVAGEDVTAAIQLPLFDRSPLDGYAMRSEDIRLASADKPVILDVIEEYRAGCVPLKEISRGTASKLMTGAPLPRGADVVIKYEDIVRIGDKIKVFYALKPDTNVIFAGEDVRQGECVVRQGERMDAARIGALAAVDVGDLFVRRRVKIALLATGDELLSAGEPIVPGKIFNSNLPYLSAACKSLGAEVVKSGCAADRKEEIIEQLRLMLSEADLVITTGGVSAGDYDFVPDCFREIGAEVLFQGVSVKPGSPVIGARFKDKVLLGLSGNAAAAAVTFQLLAAPLLKKMAGLTAIHFPRVKAVLMDDFPKNSPQRRFLRGKFVTGDRRNEVYLTGGQGNGAIRSLLDCNALVDVKAGSGALSAGTEVTAVLTGETL